MDYYIKLSVKQCHTTKNKKYIIQMRQINKK